MSHGHSKLCFHCIVAPHLSGLIHLMLMLYQTPLIDHCYSPLVWVECTPLLWINAPHPYSCVHLSFMDLFTSHIRTLKCSSQIHFVLGCTPQVIFAQVHVSQSVRLWHRLSLKLLHGLLLNFSCGFPWAICPDVCFIFEKQFFRNFVCFR